MNKLITVILLFSYSFSQNDFNLSIHSSTIKVLNSRFDKSEVISEHYSGGIGGTISYNFMKLDDSEFMLGFTYYEFSYSFESSENSIYTFDNENVDIFQLGVSYTKTIYDWFKVNIGINGVKSDFKTYSPKAKTYSYGAIIGLNLKIIDNIGFIINSNKNLYGRHFENFEVGISTFL